MKVLGVRKNRVLSCPSNWRIQLDLDQNAKDLDAWDPRSTVHAEMKSYGIEGRCIALVVGRFGEFSKDFVKLRDCIARQRAYAYNEHFNSSVNMAMSMFKLSITSRWALTAARGWARLILDRRRDVISDRPNRATAAEAPLDEARERYHFDNPTTHTRRISTQRSSIANLLCPVLFCL
jgi:hypothetical protein